MIDSKEEEFLMRCLVIMTEKRSYKSFYEFMGEYYFHLTIYGEVNFDTTTGKIVLRESFQKSLDTQPATV